MALNDNVELIEKNCDRKDYNMEGSDAHSLPFSTQTNEETELLPLVDRDDSLPSYPCISCEKVFKRKSELKRHISRHTGQKSFRCGICLETFYHGGQLKKHRREAHPDAKPFICSVCFEGCESKYKLSLHMKESHSLETLNTFQCEICDIMFEIKDDLKKHDKTVHERSETNTCLFCGQRFSYPSDLKRHERKHTGFRPYICNLCEKPYPTANQLTNHMQQHLQKAIGEKCFQCGECKKSFTSSSDLKRHLRRAHKADLPFTCRICQKIFPTREEFHTHRQEAHGIKVVPIVDKFVHECHYCSKKFRYPSDIKRHLITHSSKKAYKCDYCNKAFKGARHAEQHALTCTGDDLGSPSKKSKATEQEQIDCLLCQKTFTKHGLKIHMGVSHKSTFTCKTCHDVFESKDQLIHHKEANHAKLFGCTYCCKNFKNKQILENHIRIHTKETPFQCHLCGRQFKQRGHMKSHMSVHEERKEIVCQYCDKKFIRLYDLRRHMKKHHGVDMEKVGDVQMKNDEIKGIDNSVKGISNAATGRKIVSSDDVKTKRDNPITCKEVFKAVTNCRAKHKVSEFAKEK